MRRGRQLEAIGTSSIAGVSIVSSNQFIVVILQIRPAETLILCADAGRQKQILKIMYWKSFQNVGNF
jgi:hypothetical protein